VRRDFQLLRDRRFALLFAARTISMLGTSFAPVALAFGVLALPGSTPTTLSVVLAAEAIPTVVFMLVGGVVADRFPRYRVMMVAEILSATGFAGIGLMLLTGRAPLAGLVAAAAVAGTAVALMWPALTGIIPEVVPSERLQPANALLQLGANASRISGYALGGLTVVLVGGGWALIISAAMFALAAVLVAALRLGPVAVTRGRSAFVDLRDGWREFVSRQWLWVIVLQFSFLVAALQASHGVLGPVVAKSSLGGAGAWTAFLVGEAAGTILGVFVAMRVRPRRPMLFAEMLMLPVALPALLLGVGAPLWTLVLGGAVMGVCLDVFLVIWQTTLQREIAPGMLSRVSAYDALGSFMLGPIGLLLAGPAASAFGARPALLVCAGVILVATLASLLSPSVRRMRGPSVPRPAVATAAPPDASAVSPDASSVSPDAVAARAAATTDPLEVDGRAI
jgi:hypothetical protein